MSDLVVVALVPLASLTLVLLFLTVVYLKGGKDDLTAAANAIHKVRSTVGVGAAVQATIEAWRSHRPDEKNDEAS